MSENEAKKLDFSLPESAGSAPARRSGGGMVFLLLILVLLVGANLYLTWSRPGSGPSAAGAAEGDLPASDLKDLALKLEKQGLGNAAATAWKEYLAAGTEDSQPSAIWYRIGTLYQEADSHEEALAAFPGCAVVISHDRWFLDRIATHVLAFEGDSQVRWFEGNFSEYESYRRNELGEDSQPTRIKYKPLAR